MRAPLVTRRRHEANTRAWSKRVCTLEVDLAAARRGAGVEAADLMEQAAARLERRARAYVLDAEYMENPPPHATPSRGRLTAGERRAIAHELVEVARSMRSAS